MIFINNSDIWLDSPICIQINNNDGFSLFLGYKGIIIYNISYDLVNGHPMRSLKNISVDEI